MPVSWEVVWDRIYRRYASFRTFLGIVLFLKIT